MTGIRRTQRRGRTHGALVVVAITAAAVACSSTTTPTAAPTTTASGATSAGSSASTTAGSTGVTPSTAGPTTTRPASTAHATDDPAVVVTDKGPIKGSVTGGARTFLGVPFAAPPIGARRWTMPVPHDAWTAERDANSPGSLCPQIGFNSTKPGGVEDCLYLNVYAPANAKAGAPVMVWFHGGGFVLGSPGFTQGTALAERYGAVVVLPAYRIGPLGFLALDELAQEDANRSTGSYGIADQQRALEWVQDNAAAFGGDPANVTIFGESAGGMSVCDHLVSPRSAGLFHRAIVQSGPCAMPLTTIDAGQAQGDAMASALGCTTAPVVACLRTKSPDELLTALPNDGAFGLTGGTRWGPTLDGYVLTGQVKETIASGAFNKVPTVVGWNVDEGKLFNALAFLLPNKALTADGYQAAVTTLLRDEAKVQQVVARYPASAFPTPGDAFAQAIGDAAIKCPGHTVAVELAAQGVPTWVYSFAYPKATFQVPIPGYDLGAFHSAEIQFAFGMPLKSDDAAEDTLGDEMSSRWAAFAKTGDPSTGSPAWPAFDGGAQHLVFDTVLSTGHDLDKDVCAFWDTIGFGR